MLPQTMAMKLLRLAAGFACLQALSACSYDGLRMVERGRCAAMPQSLGERCYQRTQDTKAEYDDKRAQLKQSLEKDDAAKAPSDPRYDAWLP